MVAKAQVHLNDLTQLENRMLAEANSEQRKWKRLAVRCEAELYPMDRNRVDRSPIEVALRNISRGGAGLLCSQPLEEESLWRLCLCNQGEIVGQQAVSVAYCIEVHEGAYLIGVSAVLDSGVLRAIGMTPDEIR